MVYIVVLNWRGAADTLACLESLANLKGVRYRIVVCDNDSPDNSYDSIRSGILESKSFEKYELIELDREQAESGRAYVSLNEDFITMIQTGDNLGFSGGNNVGIKYSLNQSDMDYVWILNNDTEVDRDALKNMLITSELDPSVGVCGSRMVYSENKDILQGFGGVYNKWTATSKHYLEGFPSDQVYDQYVIEHNIDYIIGASMLIPRSVIEKVGLLDQDYFLYYEELDYAARLKKHGLKLKVSVDSVVYHKEGASMNHDKGVFSDYLFVRNRLLFTKRFHKKFYFIVFMSLFLVFINRLRRFEFKKGLNVFKVILGLKF